MTVLPSLLFSAVAAWTVRGQDIFLPMASQQADPGVLVDSTPMPECAPLKWIKQDFGAGHWILNYTDETWAAYMTFLGMNKTQWPAEFHASDIHQYVFFESTFIMNHTIPLINFHLLFEASLSDKWEKNPYPQVTPAGLDPHASVNLSTFRNVFEKPGVPHVDSCWALRTDMPVLQKQKDGKMKEFIVTFWRELTSPIDMRCTLYVHDPDTKQTIEPWATQMSDAKPFPGYSYRYFRKTVQSFEDTLRRLPCAPTGKRPGTYFC